MATISNTPRPGYVWDATDNCWYPIGTGPHSHADYITSSSAINPNIVDAKGDIVTATADNTPARLAVGTDGQVLTADSTQSTGLKWATGAIPANDSATVAATQSTTSTSYTDLTTTGPAVTVTTGTKALVIITAQIYNSSSAAVASMSYAVSGATTTAASDTTRLLNVTASTTNDIRASAANVATLTAGSNTFTAKYKCGASGTAWFGDRSIIVINLA